MPNSTATSASDSARSNGGFSRISVDSSFGADATGAAPNEERETVIRVGRQAAAAAAPPAGRPAAAPVQAAPSQAAPGQAAPGAKRPEDAYRETTLEDLERQPMPIAQIVVLVAAVLLIAAFAVYFLFLR